MRYDKRFGSNVKHFSDVYIGVSNGGVIVYSNTLSQHPTALRFIQRYEVRVELL